MKLKRFSCFGRAVLVALAAFGALCIAAQSRATGQTASSSQCPFCPEMVRIPAGEYTMGSPLRDFDASQYERPVHRVHIKAFEIGKYAVTFEQWDACIQDGVCTHRPLDHGWGRERRPVVDVSWEDAKQFVGWLNANSTGGFRLPTEAEWEYAARAGTVTVRYWGDGIDRDRANCDGCGSTWDNLQTAPCGSFAANAFGLYDMLGNVWQWVNDCWHDSYAGAPRDGRSWIDSGNCKARVARGGSWNYTRRFIRSAGRDRFDPTLRFYDLGFRVARDVQR